MKSSQNLSSSDYPAEYSEGDVEMKEIRQKQFEFDSFSINYQNKYEVIRLGDENYPQELTINNHLCHLENQILKKVSDIIIDGKLIRITDCFNLDLIINKKDYNLPQALPDSEICQELKFSSNKKHIIKKQPYIPGLIEERQMSYKNTIKNIVRLFISWLKSSTQPMDLGVLKTVEKMIEKKNFNNQLMVGMAQNLSVNTKFSEFLDNHLEQAIRESKIKEKESHINSIKHYKQLMLEKKQISEFKEDNPSNIMEIQ